MALKVTGLAADLEWWSAHRRGADAAEMRAVLARLVAWKAQHDADRAAQPGPFLKMAWDGVFADDHARAAEAIAQIEQALGERA